MNVMANITLDLARPGYVTVYGTQGDRLTRKITATLTANGTAWTPPAGTLAVIYYTKPDGTQGFYDTDENGDSAYTISSNTITFVMAAQALAVPGNVAVNVRLYNASEEILTSFAFVMTVMPGVPDEEIESSDYYNVMEQTLAGMAQAVEDFHDAMEAGYGAPLVASTVAGMTDHTKVYVYVGSETGYVNGDWYYWDGTQWADGGVYNSAAIDLDTTLTSTTKPAQGKAVGDALALKQNTLTFDNAPASGSNNPVKSGGIYTALQGKQDTLTIDSTPTEDSTNPVESGGVYDELSELKSDLNDIEDDYYEENTVEKDLAITSERNSGYVDVNGTIQNSDSYVYTQRIEVTPGDIITGRGTDSNYHVETALAMQRICAYSNNVAVSASGVSSYVTTYTVPENIDSIVISYLVGMVDVTIYRHTENYVELVPKIDNIETVINEVVESESKTVAESRTPSVINGKFVNTSGTESSSSSYYYFVIDNLKAGNVVIVRTFYGESTSIVLPVFRFVCAYDENGVAQSSKGAENVTGGTFTVPTGITKLAISIATTYPVTDVVILGDKTVNFISVDDNLKSVAFASFPQSVSGALSASGTLSLTANSVKKHKAILFNGTISAFNQLTIGQGTNDINSAKYVIDNTNITYYRGTDETGVAHAHGLTFADYISCTITVGEDHKPTVLLMTNGGDYTVTDTGTWVGCMSNVYASADASTSLTDCVLSFTCGDIDAPLWVFGDSYVSFSADRWPWYINKLGLTDFLLNGYSGAPSAYAMKDLHNLLQYGAPKYIVWAMGMNDADTDSVINIIWKSVYDELVGICNEYNITLILATIPNVPSRNHSFKNAVITASGYDYIDFASAVGALNDTSWYSGMLSQDGVHPTEAGAMALASAVLKDFPYIALR